MSTTNKTKTDEKQSTKNKENDAIAKNNITETRKTKHVLENLLNPNADQRVKKLETLNRLAEKKKLVDLKLDELTNYNASNDDTLSKMEFSADNGYKFSISNPITISKILLSIESDLFDLQEKTNEQILNFQI